MVGWIPIFGASVQVAARLDADVTAYRKQIVSYIPFAYGPQLEAIFTLIGTLTPEEAEAVVRVYAEKTSDVWRFHPESLVRAAERFHLRVAVPVLLDFVREKRFSSFLRVAVLEGCERIQPDANLLRAFFVTYSSGDDDDQRVAGRANELLIDHYRDKDAILWRLDQVEKRAFKFVEPPGVHTVSGHEAELMRREFARPLANLKDESYIGDYLKLLGKSLDLIKQDKGYMSYAGYVWHTVNSYFDNLKEKRSYQPIRALERYLQEHLQDEGVNWVTNEISRLRRSYVNHIGKPSSFADCVQTYNDLKSKQRLKISSPQGLLEVVERIIDNDVRLVVEGEARDLLRGKESTMQKILSILLRDCFLRYGFRYGELVAPREPQLLDDTRTDFLIYYGLIGPILMEIKRSNHRDLGGTDLSDKDSYRSLRHYMENYRAFYGIFLVIDDKERSGGSITWDAHLRSIRGAYSMIPNVRVLGLSIMD